MRLPCKSRTTYYERRPDIDFAYDDEFNKFNAINYGKINGHIHVILKVENDQIVGEVKDDGIGISENTWTESGSVSIA